MPADCEAGCGLRKNPLFGFARFPTLRLGREAAVLVLGAFGSELDSDGGS